MSTGMDIERERVGMVMRAVGGQLRLNFGTRE
jgi:hypothetical protein